MNMKKAILCIRLVRELVFLAFASGKLAEYIVQVVIPALNYYRVTFEKLHFQNTTWRR